MTSPQLDPLALVDAAIARTLALARTWPAWSGQPILADDGERFYTPHKAIRRTADHLLDHLAEIQALLSGATPIPDGWVASLATTPADLAAFTEQDLTEADERLRRLGALYRWVLSPVSVPEWDAPRGDSWTLRTIVEHVGDAWYAEQVGDLSAIDE